MSEIDELKARVTELEKELAELPMKLLSDVKKLMSMHTHTVNSKVIWALPADVIKRMLGEKKSVKEQVQVRDDFKIKLTKVGEIEDG